MTDAPAQIDGDQIDLEPIDIPAFLARHGYDDVPPVMCRDLQDGTLIFVWRLLFHWTLLRCYPEECGPCDQWCYTTLNKAMGALLAFPLQPPATYEPAGWHKHPKTGRLRIGGNPNREYMQGDFNGERRLRATAPAAPAPARTHAPTQVRK